MVRHSFGVFTSQAPNSAHQCVTSFNGLCFGVASLPVAACHELRNPLHAILAMIGFLAEDTSLGRQQQHDIASIQVCAFNMQRLVNDVLDLAKLREGKLALQPVMVRVVPCLAMALQRSLHTSLRTFPRLLPPLLRSPIP
jgi:signal transduction histidine kinase